MCKPVGFSSLAIKGFSLFELVIVLVVVALLLHFAFPYYLDTVEDSKGQVVKFQAATFGRAVENIYGQAKLSGGNEVELNGVTVVVNQFGWPAGTGNGRAIYGRQTAVECQQLWNGIFKNAPSNKILGGSEGFQDNTPVDFGIDAINGRICRYELMRKGDGRFFFDYDLKTGEVDVTISK